MQIPRLDDHSIFENLADTLVMIRDFVYNTTQVSLLLIFLFFGSILNKVGSVCLSTWDKGMDMAGRKRIIMDRSGTKQQMIRYYILFKERCHDNRFNIYIHKIMRSDEDDLHDNPWGYFTFILSGGYWETVGDVEVNIDNDEIASFKTTQHWRGPFYMQKVDDMHVHRLELKKDEDTGENISCWSLFIPFRKSRDWGFYTMESNGFKWKSAEEYYRVNEPEASPLSDKDQERDETDKKED